MEKPGGKKTAYMFYIKACREEHKRKYPGETVSLGEFSKACGQRWGTMTPADKKVFQEMSDRDKIRFDNEMKHYVPDPSQPQKKGRGKGRQAKDPNAPKRALTAFFWFCHDERPKVQSENPAWRVGDVAKELGKRWGSCAQNTKLLYEVMSERDRTRYQREMENYKKTGRAQSQPEAQEEYEDEEEYDED